MYQSIQLLVDFQHFVMDTSVRRIPNARMENASVRKVSTETQMFYASVGDRIILFPT